MASQVHYRFDRTGDKRWYNDKKQLHREDGPAIERLNGEKIWCALGRRHREDGPAIMYKNGRKQWWINGTRIR